MYVNIENLGHPTNGNAPIAGQILDALWTKIRWHLLSHPLLYARIPENWLKVHQFGVLFPIPYLTFTGNIIE
jgi:hypothetical protein